jgi:hypothetical protein
MKGIYCNDFQSVVQLTQKWTAVNVKSKKLVIAQSHEGSFLIWSSVEVTSNLPDVLASKNKSSFFSMFLCRPTTKGVAQIKCKYTPNLDLQLALSWADFEFRMLCVSVSWN